MQSAKTFVPDPYYEQEPQCVLCGPKRTVNRRLHASWVYWTNDLGVGPANPPPGPNYVHLGHYGRHDLFISPEAQATGYLPEFILFMLATPEPTGGGAASGPAAKGGVQGRSNNRNVPYDIVKPTGPVTGGLPLCRQVQAGAKAP